MPLLRPEAPAKKKAAIHAEVKRSKFAAWQHGRTWLSRPMTRLTLQQGDGSHCLARRRRPDAGADEEDVKPRPPWHAAPAPPVKPRPPPHPQTAPFRATLPRHGRSQLHHDANSPRQGRSRLHHDASDLTQGRAHETQTTLACRTSGPVKRDHPHIHKLPHFEPHCRDRGGPGYTATQTAPGRGGPGYITVQAT